MTKNEIKKDIEKAYIKIQNRIAEIDIINKKTLNINCSDYTIYQYAIFYLFDRNTEDLKHIEDF